MLPKCPMSKGSTLSALLVNFVHAVDIVVKPPVVLAAAIHETGIFCAANSHSHPSSVVFLQFNNIML